MWISKVNEFIGSSPEGFEQAAQSVVTRANHSLRGITGVEVLSKRVKVEGDRIVEYRVALRLVFDMAPESEVHW